MNLMSEKRFPSSTEKRKGVEGCRILLTIDVEDWFQVENFKPWIPFETWDRQELRVEKNVHLLLDLFDSFSVNRKTGESIHATFFVLGWLADRLPGMVREIRRRGHEVASHGANHRLPNALGPDELTSELVESKRLLEDVIGEEIKGYRAPSFSINNGVLDGVRKAGYRYDSSYNSFALHGRYGKVDFSKKDRKGIAIRISNGFWQIPLSNLIFHKIVLPWSGGGYFRLFPFFLFKQGIREILKTDNAYVMYIHPWEIDPKQPRVREAYPSYRFRHYMNLNRTLHRLKRLMQTFHGCAYVSCKEYLLSLEK